MMQRSFAHMDKQFIELRTEFKGLEYKFDTLDGKISNSQENRISRLEDEVRVIKNKLEGNN
jgi:hypothetical protein